MTMSLMGRFASRQWRKGGLSQGGKQLNGPTSQQPEQELRKDGESRCGCPY